MYRLKLVIRTKHENVKKSRKKLLVITVCMSSLISPLSNVMTKSECYW